MRPLLFLASSLALLVLLSVGMVSMLVFAKPGDPHFPPFD